MYRVKSNLCRLLCIALIGSLLGITPVCAQAVEAAPIAQAQTVLTYTSLPVQGQLTSVVPDGTLFCYQVVRQPIRGTVDLLNRQTGEFLYVPTIGKTGSDSFTFIAIDDSGRASAPATVTVTVEAAKHAVHYADLEGDGLSACAQRLADAGIYEGTELAGRSYFLPEETVSRGQFLVMAMETCGLSPLSSCSDTGFRDDNTISAAIKPYCAAALQAGILSGRTDGTFDPDAPITAAEAAVLVDGLLSPTPAVPTFAAEDAGAEITEVWAAQAAADLRSCGADCSASCEPLTRREAARLLCSALTVTEERTDRSGDLFSAAAAFFAQFL